jgi:hypothetical protein
MVPLTQLADKVPHSQHVLHLLALSTLFIPSFMLGLHNYNTERLHNMTTTLPAAERNCQCIGYGDATCTLIFLEAEVPETKLVAVPKQTATQGQPQQKRTRNRNNRRKNNTAQVPPQAVAA